jgi:TIR domain
MSDEHSIFISYARADGREIAAALRDQLTELGFRVWYDVASMEGGDDWWTQIERAIEGVRVMILVLTPAILESVVARREWVHARRVGTHITPITADAGLLRSAPRWMRKVDIFVLAPNHPDRAATYERFLRQLRAPPERKPVPFMALPLADGFVPRPHEYSELTSRLLDETRSNPVLGSTKIGACSGPRDW